MFPRTLRFELPGDAMDDVRYRGGFADVLRCECGGREVAAKALRPQGISLQGMRKVSQYRQTSPPLRIGGLSPRFVEVLQGSYHMEISQASQRVGTNRGGHD